MELKTSSALTLHSRFRLAGTLLITGLLIEIATCFWVHPLAFMSFLLLACSLVGLGVILFLWTLVNMDKTGLDN